METQIDSKQSARAAGSQQHAASVIRLIFDNRIPPSTRARMNYAFRVFAAIYGYCVADENDPRDARTFLYGPIAPENAYDSHLIRIPSRYTAKREREWPRRFTKVRYAGEQFYLFHGLDLATKRPDWLGEIFEWISGGLEKGIEARDSVGRIPESKMFFESAGLPPWKPQAAMHMGWLEHTARNGSNTENLARAPSPVRNTQHIVICSHDVDFYFTTRLSALKRFLKNLAIACIVYKSSGFFRSNLDMLLRLARAARIGDYLPRLLTRLESQDCRSTLFVVPTRAHRRDPNYALAELAAAIKRAMDRGFPVELHASYSSIIEKCSLSSEAQVLESITGKRVKGNRQHWLRFDDPSKLFHAIEQAGLLFDSSFGFNETVGFRNGACFAFPPYNFETEQAYDFLEIPLAIMDGGLVQSALARGESPQLLAERVLNESRRYGWGGISVLWHNPVEPISVPEEINRVFWNCLEARKQSGEQWVSSDHFLSLCLSRYQDAGLLKGLQMPVSS